MFPGSQRIPMNSNNDASAEKVVIELSRAQALVLFEFLSRFSNDGKLGIQDEAEERVLWNMCCDLERVLVEPMRPDFDVLLQRARDTVRDPKD
jgi:hypothetical protein